MGRDTPLSLCSDLPVLPTNQVQLEDRGIGKDLHPCKISLLRHRVHQRRERRALFREHSLWIAVSLINLGKFPVIFLYLLLGIEE